MTDTPRLDQASKPLRVRNFYLGRQPVLDRRHALFGYELLFRSAPAGRADVGSGLAATASVIAHAAQLGLDRAIGQGCAFLNIDAEVLGSDIFALLPREQTVLELVGPLVPDDAVLGRMAALAGHGFRFAAEASAHGPALEPLLPLLDFVKLDLCALAPARVGTLAPRLRAAGKRLVAEKVERHAQYKVCLDLGFDFFQGFYFARPSVLGGRKLTPAQLAIVELMSLVGSEADNAQVEDAVKRDPALAINLLRLVNTAGAGAGRRIDSLGQALIVLGRRQLQRWLQIMLYADPGVTGQGGSPLLSLATTRARLMELLAQRLRPGQRNVADIGFTVGIMSLMDTLFCIPMHDIVEQIPVIDEVAQALLGRQGFFGQLLALAESLERMEEGGDAMPALRELAGDGDDLAELELDAFAWSEKVVRSVF